MRKLFAILLVSLSWSGQSYAGRCDDAYSAGDDAYNYARRGYRADSLDDLQFYARRAMNSADEAMSYSDDCRCDDAYSAADEAYSYARRAYREDDFDYAQSRIKRAMWAAESIMSAAEDCN